MKTYEEQITCINEAARLFAAKDYHVTTSFFSRTGGCEVTIIFFDIKKKERVYSDLLNYKDDNDSISFNVLPSEDHEWKFYTYKLHKHYQQPL